MEKTKKNLKGFTLIELIIVLALFSIIFALVMSFIDPVTKLMGKTSIKERTAAYVDNIGEYLDKSLHYAKYMQVFDGGYCYYDASDINKETPIAMSEVEAVSSFVTKYFDGARTQDGKLMKGKIRVLKLINEDDGLLEQGRIYESEYLFQAGDSYVGIPESADFSHSLNDIAPTVKTLAGAANTAAPSNLVINNEHFGNYSYYYKLGSYELASIPDISNYSGVSNQTGFYYSRLLPLDEYGHVKMDLSDADNFKNLKVNNFHVNIVAFQDNGTVSNKVDSNYEEVDGDGNVTLSEVRTIFKSPNHMNTVSMSLLNAARAMDTADANNILFYRLKRNEKGEPLKANDDGDETPYILSNTYTPDGKEVFLKVTPAGSGQTDPGYAEAFSCVNPGYNQNIYIIFVLPYEINDSALKLS